MIAPESEGSLLDQLADEFVERLRRGERPALEDYASEHPKLAKEIRDLFPTLAVMEQVAPSDAGSSDPDETTGPAGQETATERFLPRQIGDYRILREIGRGGMGVVYEAEQQSLSRRVALKVLPAQVSKDRRASERFRREARAAARLHHTNIVPVFDVGQDGDVCFYTMQFIQGQPLDEVIGELAELKTSDLTKADYPAGPINSVALSLWREEFAPLNFGEATVFSGDRDVSASAADAAEAQDGPFSGSDDSSARSAKEDTSAAVLPGRHDLSTVESDYRHYFRSVARVGHQVSEALSYAHARGVIHRDIKPSNLLLDATGVVWVTDFGLAKTEDESLTQTGDVVGTLRYMSPERFKGHCDARADVYGVGVTLYEMLTLRVAFDSHDRLTLMEQISSREPPRPRAIDPHVPQDLETVVLKAMEKDAKQRYQSAEELWEDLHRFLEDRPILARPISPTERLIRWARRNRPLAASLAATAALLLAVAIASIAAAGYFQNLAGRNKRLADRNGELAQANAGLADQNRAQRDEAVASRNEAVEAQRVLRRELYIADMLQVRQAYEDGTIDRVQELLDKYIPLEDQTDLRGFEWYYWWQAAHLDVQRIRSANPRSALAVSPDRKWAAVKVWRRSVVVYDTQTMRAVATLTAGFYDSMGVELAFSHDGQLLAATGSDHRVQLWQTSDWSALPSLEHACPVRAVAFSSAGLLAAADAQGRITFWNTESWRPEGAVLQTGRATSGLAFSPDGSLLVTASGEPGNAQEIAADVWDVSGRPIRKHLKQLQRGVIRVAWTASAGRSLIATGSWDGSVRLWDGSTFEELQQFSAGGLVLSLAFSSDGARLVAGTGRNNALHVWETDSGRPVSTIKGHSRAVWGAVFLDGGETLWSSSEDRYLKAWDLSHGEPYRRMPAATAVGRDRRQRLAFGADHLTLWHSAATGPVSRWDTATRAVLADFDLAGDDSHAALSDSGDLLLTLTRREGDGIGLRVWRTASPEPELQLERIIPYEDTGWPPSHIAVSADGSTIVWSSGSSLVLYDVATDQRKHWTAGEDVHDLAVSFDGSLVAVKRAWDNQVWDTAGERPLLRHTHPSHGSSCDVRFSPDGSRLAVAHWNNDVRLHDTISGSTMRYFRGHSGSVRSLAFSHDGSLLASGGDDGTVRLWDIAHGNQRTVLSGHSLSVTAVAFSRDGRTVASISEDGETRLWPAATEREVHDDVRYWERRAAKHEDRSLWEWALSDLTEAIRCEPRADLLERRCLVHLRLEQHAEALADGRMAMEITDPSDRERWNVLRELALWRPLVERSQPRVQPWRYTLKQPDDGWQDPNYDETDWKSGGPWFEAPGSGRAWPEGQIWLRREFLLPDGFNGTPSLLVYADDEVTIFLNGVEAARAGWVGLDKYQRVSCNDAAAATLQPGRNTLAVHCRNTLNNGAVQVTLGTRDSGEVLLEAVSRALETNPHNHKLVHFRAGLNLDLERWDRAAEDYVVVLGGLEKQAGWKTERSKLLLDLCRHEALFDALVRRLPGESDLWLGRARSLALESRWGESAAAYARYGEDLPDNSETWLELACSRLLVGDLAGYRETLARLREQAGETPGGFSAFVLARTTCMVPQDQDLAEQAVHWGNHSLIDNQDHWMVHALGLALFRAKDYDAARKRLQESLAGSWQPAQNQLALALASYHAGDKQLARQWLDKARQRIDKKKALAAGGPVNAQVIDWLPINVLLMEAEKLIDSPDSESP